MRIQLPNTLKESLASIEAEVEHAANLEHSKSGCRAAVREKRQKAAVEGVAARGNVYQQFRRALNLNYDSLKAGYEQCQSRQAKDLFRKEWTSKRVKVLQSRLVQTKIQSVTDFSKWTYRSLARIAVEEGNDTEAAARICRKCVELGPPFFRRCKSSMQFKFLHFEEGSDESLAKALAAKQELGEESEPKVPELVREEKRKAVKTIECAGISREAEETEIQ